MIELEELTHSKFVLDRKCRGDGSGGAVLEMAIDRVYKDYGIRPFALGCHKDNIRAARFYAAHRFIKTEHLEGNGVYYLRYPVR